MLPPIASLKLLGLICPCLESNAAARTAAWSLSAVRVRWSRPSSPKSASGMSSSVKGLFSMFTSASGGSDEATIESADLLEGVLVVADSSNGPSLAIDSQISIPLRHIQSIESTSNGITIQTAEETIQVQVLTEEGNEADESAKNETLDNLQIIYEWERTRQEKLLSEGISEEDQYPDSVKTSNVIGDRAKKIQHFAQREIELQKTKREREARKAKYVKDAGGLKYTAIAMANRS